ncbi:alpha/beta hydrolase [Mycobacterium sp. 21AC1]|uniref:alpha/beta fold hydrolase n=1 Tax=[Mycobacterium] appelbergii TaxID=2939269 RepID=UPI002939061A|nr:alpha/beta hydrolase [Mycobacterium sp. 21AC1]MDV3126722.1 alpha/beta hydrolase [Mycobacterium sp. 21AC1]
MTPGHLPQLPPGRTIDIRAADGARLHAQVFGPEDGPPIVLAHGITCAISVWAHQIADLAEDYRVIAYDHRGHGRSETPRGRHRYSLNHLAADLDAVLDATLRPGEHAVLAGHSMGGIAITSWSQRYPDRVRACAGAVALINTSTGDLLRDVQLAQVPARLSASRIRTAGTVLKTFGSTRVPKLAEGPNKRFVAQLAVGRDADPWVSEFVYELFASTPPAGRGAWARVLVDNLGPRHISVRNLTVPTLVIGSAQDRLLPINASRRIATAVPNLAALVELPGGHCAILERPAEVNAQLRTLAESVRAPQQLSS